MSKRFAAGCGTRARDESVSGERGRVTCRLHSTRILSLYASARARRSAPVLWYASGIWRRLHDQRSREAREKEHVTEGAAAIGRADSAGVTSTIERGHQRPSAIRTDRAQSTVPSDRRAVRDETFVIHPNSSPLAVQVKNSRV